jgi:acetyltransferase-like isoleucine patch superfamily enzyme
MFKNVPKLLDRLFRKTLLYQALVGGIQYYRSSQINTYSPSRFLHFGNNARVAPGVSIACPEKLHIGDSSDIGPACSINAIGGCFIGRGSTLGPQCVVLTSEHSYSLGEALPYDKVRHVKPVHIGDFVWIGANVLIVGGIRIGEGAIVGMGSVVLQDIPPMAIVMGNPARVIMYRSAELFDRAKLNGVLINPYEHLPLLKVPAVTKRKFKSDLEYFGFDLAQGDDCFRYDKPS